MIAGERHLDLYRRHYASKPLPDRTPSRWLRYVEILAGYLQADTAIDYGCGVARGLSLSRVLVVQDYDPGVPGFDRVPPPQEIVCSIHALEHIEPETLDAVVAHIESLALKAVLLVISTQPSTKRLPDGSPWHSLVRSGSWWQAYLTARGYKPLFKQSPKEYAAVLYKPTQENTT